MTHRVHVYRSLEELMLQFFGAWQLLGRDDLAHFALKRDWLAGVAKNL